MAQPVKESARLAILEDLPTNLDEWPAGAVQLLPTNLATDQKSPCSLTQLNAMRQSSRGMPANPAVRHRDFSRH